MLWKKVNFVSHRALMSNSFPENIWGSKARRTMQDFSKFTEYFIEPQRETLTNPKVSLQARMDMTIMLLLHIGCRCASESTKKRMTSFVLVLSEQHALTENEITQVKKNISCGLQRSAKKMPDPLVYFTVLPEPSELASWHPVLFKRLFSDHQPVPCKVDALTLMVRDASSKCRNLNT